MATVRSSCCADALYLAERLRREDEVEIRARSGRRPLDVLHGAVDAPGQKTFSILNESNLVIGMFGIGHYPQSPKIGHPWLVGSPDLFDMNLRQILKESKSWLATISDSYSVLQNFALAENETHIFWIKKMGFVVSEKECFFADPKHPFYSFHQMLRAI